MTKMWLVGHGNHATHWQSNTLSLQGTACQVER